MRRGPFESRFNFVSQLKLLCHQEIRTLIRNSIINLWVLSSIHLNHDGWIKTNTEFEWLACISRNSKFQNHVIMQLFISSIPILILLNLEFSFCSCANYKNQLPSSNCKATELQYTVPSEFELIGGDSVKTDSALVEYKVVIDTSNPSYHRTAQINNITFTDDNGD